MKFLLILLAIVIGIVVFLAILTYAFLSYLKGSLNISTAELKQMIKESNETRNRVKSVSGMSKVLVPKILRDYSSFNEADLYRKVESGLRNIFNSLEKRELVNSKELTIVSENIKAEIEDLISSNTKVKYDDIKFHEHAIRDYTNEDGFLCITVESSLEYFYSKYKDDKKVSDDGIKKQNVYTTKFIHIYDPDKFVESKQYLAAHCPNCGAPLKNYQDNHCEYCNSGVEPMDLKSWYLSSYKSKY